MPYTSEWMPNELAVEHNGVKVFHTYRDNEESQGKSGAYFCWSADNNRYGDSCGEYTFDVRDLPSYAAIVEGHRPPFVWSGKGKPDAGYQRKSPALERRWAKYHQQEPELIRQVIRKALDSGALKPPTGLAAAKERS